MSTSVKLPQWGMSMSEGEIAKWLVVEGDAVEVGQDLVEVEAAKVTNTIPSPAAGTAGPVLVPEGETVEVNTVLMEIYAPGESPAASEPTSAPTSDDRDVTASADVAPTSSRGAPRDADAARAASGRITGVVPLARKLAKEHGVDLTTVTATGRHGRIVVDDVRAVLEGTGRAPEAAAASPDAPSTLWSASVPGQSHELSSMRRVIGERMTASLRDSAQLTLTSTADVTDFAQLRADVGAGARKPGYVDLVVRACALALRDHPGVNSYLEGENVVVADAVNIGLAVALDDGLVVPVIHDADRLGLAEVGTHLRELADAARGGHLSPEDYEGGTFSITSLGGQGIDVFTPIVNPPQSGILGVGRSREVPVRFGDGIAWRQEMTLSLTIDHRLVDGYPGALFLQDVVRRMERPRELL